MNVFRNGLRRLKKQKLSLYLILQLFFLSNAPLFSHTWEWLNPFPQGNILNDCAVVNDSTIIIVGMSGTIFISFDYGKSWKDYFSTIDNSVNLNSVAFYDDQNGIVVGGFIIATTDGGKSWSEKYSVEELLSVDYATSDVIYSSGYGGRVIKSEDKGMTWIQLNTNVTEDLYGISFINADTGIVVGDEGSVLKTIDGGKTWNNISDSNMFLLRCVSMITDNRVIVGGLRGELYVSNNAGENWDKITDPYLNVFSYSAIAYADSNNIFACGGYSFTGSYCTIVKSPDGGENWSLVYNNMHPIQLSGISANDEKVISVGFDGSIFSSNDTGSTWSKMSAGNTAVVLDVSALDSLNIITLTRSPTTVNTLYKTTDGGKTWTDYTIPTNQPLFSLSFADNRNGMVVGGWGTILKTSDGGITWNKIDISDVIDTTKYLNRVDALDSANYFIVGDSGLVLKTTDEGKSWSKNVISIYSLYDVTFSSLDQGYAVGWDKAFYTMDGGMTWQEGNNHGSEPMLFSVSALDNNIAYAVGDAGIVFKTTDGGKNWEEKPTYYNYSFYSVSFFDEDIGIAVGSFGATFLTSDGGDSWINLTGRTSNQLYAVKMINDKTAILAGESGNIIKMKFDILTHIMEQKTEIAQDYELKQNYPNPFNASTKIEFSIVKREHVILKVYDILGREVKTLVNEEKQAGDYEVAFDASHLASGIYLYSMKAGDFIKTRKLVLMK